MTDFEKILENLEELIKNTREALEDHADDVKEEVIDNIKTILENDMDSDNDLRVYINDTFGMDIREMDEYEFNDWCNDNGYRQYDVLGWDLDTGDCFFGKDFNDDLTSGECLSDFIDLEKVAKEIVDDDNDLDNEEIRKELDRLKETEDGKEEFIEEVKKLLGIEDKKEDLPEPKPVNEASNL